MAIDFINLSYKRKLNKVTLSLDKLKIIGIYGIDIYLLKDLIIKKIKPSSGKILFSDKKRKLKVSVIDSDNIVFYTASVKSEINYYCKKNKVFDETFKKVIEDTFEMIKLDLSILDKKIRELSSSEIFKFYILLNVLFERDVYIFKNIFKYVDKNNKKYILNTIKDLKSKNKIILLVDDSFDNLYNNTDEIVLFKENNLLISGDTKKVLTNTKFLLDNNIKLPTLVLITYLAKTKKDVKLFFHDDVRDIMKDIYKHV